MKNLLIIILVFVFLIFNFTYTIQDIEFEENKHLREASDLAKYIPKYGKGIEETENLIIRGIEKETHTYRYFFYICIISIPLLMYYDSKKYA